MSGVAAYLTTLLHVVTDRFEKRDERGATAVEYGLLVGLIAVVSIVAVTLLGTRIDALFDSINSQLD